MQIKAGAAMSGAVLLTVLISGCSGTAQSAPSAQGFPPDKIGNLSRLSDRQAFDHWSLVGQPSGSAPGGATASPSTADQYVSQIHAAAPERFDHEFGVSASHVKSSETYQYAYVDSPTSLATPTSSPTFTTGLDAQGFYVQHKQIGGTLGTLQLDVYTLNDDYKPSVADTMQMAAAHLSTSPTTNVNDHAVYNQSGEYLAVGQHKFIIASYVGKDAAESTAQIKGFAQQVEDSGVLK